MIGGGGSRCGEQAAEGDGRGRQAERHAPIRSTASSISSSLDRERRQQANRVRAGGVDHQALLEQQRGARAPARPAGRSPPSGRARAARGRGRAGRRRSRSPSRAHRVEEAVAGHHVEHGVRRRRDHAGRRRRSSRGRRAEHVGGLGRRDAGADRQAAAQPLRHASSRRASRRAARSAHSVPVRPMPHWISSKISSAPCSSQASRAARSTLGLERVDAGLALDRLEQHGGGVARSRPRVERRGVVRAAPP